MNTYTHYATTNTNKARTLRQQRIARGLCVRCGHVPPKANSRSCANCLQDRREADKHTVGSKRKARIDNGLCVRCGISPPVEGKRSCESCRAKHRGYERARVLRRDEERKDAAAKTYVSVADVEIVDIRGTAASGGEWYWTFRNDMPTIFEPEVQS